MQKLTLKFCRTHQNVIVEKQTGENVFCSDLSHYLQDNIQGINVNQLKHVHTFKIDKLKYKVIK